MEYRWLFEEVLHECKIATDSCPKPQQGCVQPSLPVFVFGSLEYEKPQKPSQEPSVSPALLPPVAYNKMSSLIAASWIP